MKTFAVVALKRHDLTEAVVALRRHEHEARRLAGQYAVAGAGEYLRCRVQPVDLTVGQVKAICYRWGRDAAQGGEPVTNSLPGVWGEAYRSGYASASGSGPGNGQ